MFEVVFEVVFKVVLKVEESGVDSMLYSGGGELGWVSAGEREEERDGVWEGEWEGEWVFEEKEEDRAGRTGEGEEGAEENGGGEDCGCIISAVVLESESVWLFS